MTKLNLFTQLLLVKFKKLIEDFMNDTLTYLINNDLKMYHQEPHKISF